MQRIISFCLALSMLVTTFALQACAEGDVVGPYGSANGQVEDNLSDVGPVFDKQYAVAFTDFEGLSATYASGFKLYDSGIAEYDNVFFVPALSDPATPGTISTKYNWNGKEFTLFNEGLTVGKKYLISYDYYSVPSASAKNYVFSFTPKHQVFYWYNGVGADYRDETKYYSDNKWHTERIGFTATDGAVNIKLNVWSSNVETYIDNYLVMQAVEIFNNDESGLLEIDPVIDNIAITSAYQSTETTYMVAKGDKVSFKANVPSIVGVTVTCGDDVIQPDQDGVYTIDKVLDDITIETSVNKTTLNSALKKNAVIDEDNIYVPYGRNPYSLADDFFANDGFSSTKNLKIVDSFDLDKDINQKLTNEDKLYSKFGYIESDKFNVKFLGDANVDGKITVTDITSIVSRLVNGTGADNFSGMYDFDTNGSVNVTDIVNIRNNILGNTFDTRDAEADIIAKSGVKLDFTEFDKGVFNAGNKVALANVIRKAMRGEEVILATFGGSITAEGNATQTPIAESGITTTLGTDSYSDVMLHWFEDTFAKYGATFKLINAGIGATDTPYAIHRMYEDVVNAIPGKKPDMVIYEWACNDNNADYKQGTFENGVRKFLEADIPVLIFSFDLVGRGGTQYKQEPISQFYDLPHLSYGDALGALSEWQYLTNDGVHPNRVGHALAGTIISRYLSGIYNNIDSIGTEVPAIPEDTYHPEAKYYGETFIARLSEIEAGNIEGVTIKSLGSFVKDTSPRTFGNNANSNYSNVVSCLKEYYGYSVQQNDTGVYEPLVIEVDDAKTAFILFNRFNNPSGCKFTVHLGDVQLTCPYKSFTCSASEAGDNMQIESGYHWVTSRLFYNETPEKVTIKITPDLGVYNPSQARKHIKLFALLLSK